MTNNELIALAEQARGSSYAPYSGFSVGAALLCQDGSVFCGCNVENSSYPAGICAERAAVTKAVSEGNREFVCIAIVGGKGENDNESCYPCGICRQVLSEFVGSDFKIILKDNGSIKCFTAQELLPFSFRLQ